MTKAIYAFSGDPITYGHIDIIKRASAIFDKVIVAIGVNPKKEYLFSTKERENMAKLSLSNIKNVEVVSFSGLLVDYAYEQNIDVIIKGVRNSDDFNYENILYLVGESQKLNIDTHILIANPAMSHISSSSVKEIQRNHGDITGFVPLLVKQELERKVSGQYLIGITGEMGAGKSYIGEILQEYELEIPVHNIELDHIGHKILGELTEPVYVKTREEIAEYFGKDLMMDNGFINRKLLGTLVFNRPDFLKQLNKILFTPIMARLRKELLDKKGIILINSALLAEANMLDVVNNNVILVTIDKSSQRQRLERRELTKKQIDTRMLCQYTTDEKRNTILNKIKNDNHGNIWEIFNTINCDIDDIFSVFNKVKESFEIK